MKTLKLNLIILVASLFSMNVHSQCYSVTGINMMMGSSNTATLYPSGSVTVAPSTTHIYWTITPSVPVTSTSPMPSSATGMFAFTAFPASSVVTSYTVCATVIDSLYLLGCPPNVYCHTFTIAPTSSSSCTANFSYFTDSLCLTHFTNTSTGAFSGSQWKVDGINYSTAPTLSLSAGTHSVILTNYNLGVVSCVKNSTISVVCPTSGGGGTVTPTCHSNFSIYADPSGSIGAYVGVNSSTGLGLSYLWSFGDGTSSTLAYPTHTYSPPGHYIVCLTVTSGTTCTSVHCDSSSVFRTASSFLMSSLNIHAPGTPTAIKELSEVINLNVYPNPFDNELMIEVQKNENTNCYYNLLDALGRIVNSGSLNSNKATIFTSQLEKGFYTLSIKNEKGDVLKTIKLIK